MHFKGDSFHGYQGSLEPGKGCLVPREGMLTYLVSEVFVDQTSWSSRDRGFDPQTDQLVWGSEHGFLKFERMASLAEHLQDDWLIGLSD